MVQSDLNPHFLLHRRKRQGVMNTYKPIQFEGEIYSSSLIVVPSHISGQLKVEHQAVTQMELARLYNSVGEDNDRGGQ